MCTNIRYRVFKGNCRPLESDELYLTQKETYIQNSNTILSFHKGKGLSTWLASQRDRGKATVWVRLHKRFAQLSFGQHYLSNFRTLIFDMFSTTNNVWLLTLLVQSEDNEILHRQWSTSRYPVAQQTTRGGCRSFLFVLSHICWLRQSQAKSLTIY